MTDIDNLRALYEKATPGEWFYAGQDDIEAEAHMLRAPFIPPRFDGPGKDGFPVADVMPGNEFDWQIILALHNAFPALASELEAARKVVAEHRWRHDDEECVCKPAEMGFDGIKDARLCSVAEYLRVMEEQR